MKVTVSEATLTTRFTERLGVRHPVVLGGMGSGTGPALVAAVSAAGGLGVQGCAGRSPAEIAGAGRRRSGRRTAEPFGLNLLLFRADEAAVEAPCSPRGRRSSPPPGPARTPTWPACSPGPTTPAPGSMHMVSTLAEARRAPPRGRTWSWRRARRGAGTWG